jgi:hypothetical protein
LREDLERVSKKWKSYQRGRLRKGKVSKDWEVPKVRVAWMRAVTETVSPYEEG